MHNVILLSIIIYIFFYIINKSIYINEHYLTYFLPYYNNNNTDLALFYKNNENNLNYFKKKFKYQILNFGTISKEKYYIEKVISDYIKNGYSINSHIIYYKDRLKLIDDLVNNNINFCDTNYSTILYYTNVLKKNINNLRLIKTLYKLYFYFFTKKKYNVFSIGDIPPNFIIGIIHNDNIFYYYKNLLSDLSYEENIDYKIKLYENSEDLYNGFINSECNMIILYDIFPNESISNFLDNNFIDDIILLEFNIPNEKLFLKKQSILKVDYIDLNKLSYYYLPKKIGNYTYSKNNPTIKILYTYKIIISNLHTKSECAYDFFKFFAENYKNLNYYLEKGFHIDRLQINDNSNNILLEYHKGVIDYYIEKGYITNTNNINCKYLVGSMKCTEETLIQNGL